MKHRLTAVSLVLVASSVAACGGGGGGGAPSAASEEEFCDTFNSLFTDMSSMSQSEQDEVVQKIKDWGEEMEEVGTPEDIPDDARDGFETSIELIGELDEDATTEDFEKLGDDLSKDEEDAVDAFDTYTTDTCGSPMENMSPSAPSTSGAPSESPSE